MALEFSVDPISLDMEIGGDGNSTIGEYIEDRKAYDPSKQVSLTGLRDNIGKVLDSLSKKEREIVIMDKHKKVAAEHGLDESFVEEVFLSMFNESKRIQAKIVEKK